MSIYQADWNCRVHATLAFPHFSFLVKSSCNLSILIPFDLFETLSLGACPLYPLWFPWYNIFLCFFLSSNLSSLSLLQAHFPLTLKKLAFSNRCSYFPACICPFIFYFFFLNFSIGYTLHSYTISWNTYMIVSQTCTFSTEFSLLKRISVSTSIGHCHLDKPNASHF